MLRLVYVSSATHLFSKEEIARLLVHSRRGNEAKGITGLLLYKGGNFMQVLEGEADQLEPLIQKISADPRHSGISILLRETTTERDFPDWSMGFRDLQDTAVHATPGYNDFLNAPLDPTWSSSRCRKLLSVFKNRM